MLKRTILCAVLALSIPAQASAKSWLCIADMGTGFKFEKTTKEWRQVTFKVEKSRFIISATPEKQWAYEVKEFGKSSPYPDATCKNGFSEYGYLNCTGLFGSFKFNNKNLRYLATYLAGYVEIIPGSKNMIEGDDTPSMEIGRCSPL